MAAARVLHEPVDALGFAQPGDELVVALVVLHRVGPAAVAAREAQHEGPAVAREHLRDDGRHVHFLEDAEIRAARGEPQPGLQGEPVGDLRGGVLPAHAEAGDDAVQVAAAQAFGFDGDGGAQAEQGLRVDALVLREQVDLEAIQRRQRFLSLQLAELQGLSQGCLNGHAACVMRSTVSSRYFCGANYGVVRPANACHRRVNCIQMFDVVTWKAAVAGGSCRSGMESWRCHTAGQHWRLSFVTHPTPCLHIPLPLPCDCPGSRW